jgi:hypothetical protein
VLGRPTAIYEDGQIKARALCPGCFAYAATVSKRVGDQWGWASTGVTMETAITYRARVAADGWSASVTIPEDAWSWERISEA